MTDKMKELKLTARQKQVVKDMRDGYVMVTDYETIRGALITKGRHTYQIGLLLYKNLIRKDLLDNSDHTLTELGKTIEL